MDLLQKLLTTPFEFLRDYGGPFIIVLSILVFIHEFGHYIIARLCGVRVLNFSIGFGKELWGRTDKHGTRWKFCLIPLGGYVQMFGDVDPASVRHTEGEKGADGTVRPFTDEEKKVAFFAQSVGKRAAIVLAGPAINYIFAIIVLALLYTFQGQAYVPSVVAKLIEGSPAEKAGIRVDDKIIAINGEPVTRFQEVKRFITLNLDRELEITFVRSIGDRQWSDKSETVSLIPQVVQETDRFGFKHSTGRMGIVSPSSAFEVQEHSFGSAFVASLQETWRISVDTLYSIGQMVMGTRSAEELGGILRIGAYAGDFAQQGLIAFITFGALLSINLGLINLLPIPMLDGGHLMMYAFESLRGKPLSERIQEYALRVGVVFLLGIMLFATWNDLVQLNVVSYLVKLVS
jgi:regulator of sigma E protease